jgi:hypothetical protein
MSHQQLCSFPADRDVRLYLQADLTIYREAGAQVAGILSRLSVCERASIDEVSHSSSIYLVSSFACGSYS